MVVEGKIPDFLEANNQALVYVEVYLYVYWWQRVKNQTFGGVNDEVCIHFRSEATIHMTLSIPSSDQYDSKLSERLSKHLLHIIKTTSYYYNVLVRRTSIND